MGVGPRAARAPRAPGGRMATGSALRAGRRRRRSRADAWWCETNGAECGPWQEGQPLPEPVTFAALAAATSSFFLVGGLTASGASASVYRGDPGPDGLTWTEQQPLPAPVFAAAATIVGDQLYVLGGAPSFEGFLRRVARSTPLGWISGRVGAGRHPSRAGPRPRRDRNRRPPLARRRVRLVGRERRRLPRARSRQAHSVDAAALATPRFAMGVAEGDGAVYLVGGWTAGFAELTGGIVWASACP